MKKNTFILMYIMLVLSASFTFAQQRETPPVTFNKISDRLYEIQGGSGAAGGVYIGDDSVIVIDAKMDEASQKAVFEKIAALTGKPIKYLVNTHSDGDHINGNRYFPETVTIIAHENCRKEFLLPGRNGAQSEWETPELAPFVPSVTFRDKMDIYLGGKKVELSYHGIGHTTGDVFLYFAEEKTAFIGDMVFVGRPQLIHAYKGGNTFKYVATVSEMLESTDADKFFTGHSGMINRTQIENHLEQMKQLQVKVKTLIAQNKTIAQIQSEFEENESGLVETIYNELKNPE
ncbi:MBL fold metallo-hydrolase [Candidatus Latescibacterota bacterium]